uniref:Uncharacterized protein n=1 Tax=Medicago truncatula TaxID=3880 RepID=I3S1I3_MEDTR|nr:unknown [Medicago truncatula]
METRMGFSSSFCGLLWYNCNGHLLLAASMHCRNEGSSVHCHVHPSSSCTHSNFLSNLVERNTLLGKYWWHSFASAWTL